MNGARGLQRPYHKNQPGEQSCTEQPGLHHPLLALVSSEFNKRWNHTRSCVIIFQPGKLNNTSSTAVTLIVDPRTCRDLIFVRGTA